MRSNPTDGSEYNNGITIPGVLIGHTNCDYCEKKIIAVWDEHNKGKWWPYLGNQARKPKVYVYSEIIQAMRSYYGKNGVTWNNNLLNVHARAHTFPKDYGIIAHGNGIRLLCNVCFQLTYRRVKIIPTDRPGYRYEISVLPSRGETLEIVTKDLGILSYEIIN